MAEVTERIEVDAPISTVYNQWTQFEQFPQFMEGIEEVRQLDDKRLFWHANIAGKDQQWEAEITEQTPDQVIAWRSTTGAPNGGRLIFESLGGNRTAIDLTLEYEPQGIIEQAGDALGFVQRRVRGDLERFKEFIESRGGETGGWRGEIQGGQVDQSTNV